MLEGTPRRYNRGGTPRRPGPELLLEDAHMNPRPPRRDTPAKPDGEHPPSKQDDAAHLFYKRLEQTGQLIDVDSSTDLASLPPSVTHVRYPDGRIERIGFSSSPYGAG